MALRYSEEVDKIFLQAIELQFPRIITDEFGYLIVIRIIHLFERRGNYKVYSRILHLFGINALYLTRNTRGNKMVENAIDVHDPDCIMLMALELGGHYVELSFEELGSNVVEKLVGESVFALVLTVKEFMECDEDTLVRLAKDEYGIKVLKKTLEFAKQRRVNLFDDLTDKLKPLLDPLRWFAFEKVKDPTDFPVAA